jgi:hypothetical protein
MSLTLTDIQEVPLSVAPVDAAGNPGKIDGVPAWTASDPTVGTLQVAADGLTAKFVTTGKLGVCQVTVTANPTGGTAPITGHLDIEVTGSEATSLTVTAGTPVNKA